MQAPILDVQRQTPRRNTKMNLTEHLSIYNNPGWTKYNNKQHNKLKLEMKSCETLKQANSREKNPLERENL